MQNLDTKILQISSKKWKMIEKGEKAENRAGKATTHENEMNGEIS